MGREWPASLDRQDYLNTMRGQNGQVSHSQQYGPLQELRSILPNLPLPSSLTIGASHSSVSQTHRPCMARHSQKESPLVSVHQVSEHQLLYPLGIHCSVLSGC